MQALLAHVCSGSVAGVLANCPHGSCIMPTMLLWGMPLSGGNNAQLQCSYVCCAVCAVRFVPCR